MRVSACICVRNQRDHLVELLKQLTGRVDEIVVVDGYSTDGTYDACLYFDSVRVYRVSPKGYADPDRPLCVSLAKNNWVLCLDADERPSPIMIRDLDRLTIAGPYGYWVPRKNYYRDGEYYKNILYPDYQLRLYNRAKAIVSDKVHGSPDVNGPVVELPEEYAIDHYDAVYNSAAKYKFYARQQAREWVAKWPRPLYPLIAVYQAVKDFWLALKERCYMDGLPGIKAGINRAVYTGMVYYYMTFGDGNN